MSDKKKGGRKMRKIAEEPMIQKDNKNKQITNAMIETLGKETIKDNYNALKRLSKN